MNDVRKIYRSRTNKMISGVCGGIAEYFNIDPTIVRLMAVCSIFLSFLFGACIAYIICACVIPQQPD